MIESVIGGDDFFDFVFRSFFEESAMEIQSAYRMHFFLRVSNDDGAAFFSCRSTAPSHLVLYFFGKRGAPWWGTSRQPEGGKQRRLIRGSNWRGLA